MLQVLLFRPSLEEENADADQALMYLCRGWLCLQDKVAIKRAFVMAQRRSEANLQLASKLEELIGEHGVTKRQHLVPIH